MDDLTNSQALQLISIFNAPLPKRPEIPDLSHTIAKLRTARKEAEDRERVPPIRKRVDLSFLDSPKAMYPSLSPTSTDQTQKSDIPFDISINHDPAKKFPQDHYEKMAQSEALKRTKRFTKRKLGKPPSYFVKRAKYDTECAVKRDEIFKCFLKFLKKVRRRMIEDQAEYLKFVAEVEEASRRPKVEFLDVFQIRDRRLAKEQHAREDAINRAEELLTQFSPEMLAAKYEAETNREARRAAVQFDLDMAEGAIAYAERTAERLSEAVEEDRQSDALRRADKRIAEWEASMLAKIGEADRTMAEIDAAHEVASLKAFDPIVEINQLLSHESKCGSKRFVKPFGGFRF